MLSTQITMPALAMAATLAAGLSGMEMVETITSPPLITGAASYSAPVTPGEEVIVPWIITKTTDCPGYASRVWSGADGFFLSEPIKATAIPIVESRSFNIPTYIPDMLPSGRADLSIKGHFQCEDEPKRFFTLGPIPLEVASR